MLYRQITNIGFTDLLEDYVQKHEEEIESAYVWVLNKYVKQMRDLQSLCDKQSVKERGPYKDLIAPLPTSRLRLCCKERLMREYWIAITSLPSKQRPCN